MPPRVRAPSDEFTELLHRSVTPFRESFRDLGRAIAAGKPTDSPRRRVQELIAETMALSDLMGRRRAWLEFDHFEQRAEASFAATPVIPKVPFGRAIDDLVDREPRLAANAEEVARLYRDRHAFALARSSELRLTRAVQDTINRFIREGEAPSRAAITVSQLSEGIDDFSDAYARTVYRTNLNTAYSAGRFRQASDPDIRRVMPALERFSAGDSDVRRGRPKVDGGENHAAADGLVAATNDPIWETASPPSGYQCRCNVRLVPVMELQRRGLIDGAGRVIRFEPPGFRSFRPHPNFARGRPDRIYRGGSVL